MRRLLVPVRDEQAVDAVQRAIRVKDSADGLYVVLLNVQPKPVEWQTRGLYRDAIRTHLLERGRKACQPIAACLAAAGISYHTRIELGETCAEILRCAEDERCNGILLQADPLSWLQRRLLRATGWVAGSIAGQIIHSSDLPVTVVH